MKHVVVLADADSDVRGYVTCNGSKPVAFSREQKHGKKDVEVADFYVKGDRGECSATLTSPLSTSTKCSYARHSPELFIIFIPERQDLECDDDD